MDKPTPPTSPDVNKIHKHLLSMDTWDKQVIVNGIQTPFRPQAEILAMTTPEQAGKFLFNSDTGNIMYSKIDPVTQAITWTALP